VLVHATLMPRASWGVLKTLSAVYSGITVLSWRLEQAPGCTADAHTGIPHRVGVCISGARVERTGGDLGRNRIEAGPILLEYMGLYAKCIALDATYS
jgi:hypothetical protein